MSLCWVLCRSVFQSHHSRSLPVTLYLPYLSLSFSFSLSLSLSLSHAFYIQLFVLPSSTVLTSDLARESLVQAHGSVLSLVQILVGRTAAQRTNNRHATPRAQTSPRLYYRCFVARVLRNSLETWRKVLRTSYISVIKCLDVEDWYCSFFFFSFYN